MRPPYLYTIGACALLLAQAAAADDTATLAVTGKLITAACTPTVSPATIDLGNTVYTSLQQSSLTQLPEQPFTLTVSCAAEQKVAWSDDTPVINSAEVGGSGGTDFHPLVTDDGRPVGGYSFVVDSATVDGEVASYIAWGTRSEFETQPQYSSYPMALDGSYAYETIFMATMAQEEVNMKDTIYEMRVNPMLGTQSKLNLTDDVRYASTATFTLVYL